MEERSLPFHIPDSPIRATVLGAGSHSLQLSGCTVSLSEERLPIKGLPIVRPFASGNGPPIDGSPSQFHARLKACISSYASELEPVAIVLDCIEDINYAQLRLWADALAFALQETELPEPYVLIMPGDAAMALGQLLRGRLNDRAIITLDGLNLEIGDYIDIGRPLGASGTIPVTLKSLIFSK